MDGSTTRRGKARIWLTNELRENLQQVARNGVSSAKRIVHARVLLLADEAHPEGRQTDRQIAQALGLHDRTVGRIRQRFLRGGLPLAMERKRRLSPPTPRKLDGQKEAILVALCCSKPPKGRRHWSLQLLVNELVQRSIVASICKETVRQTLKKTNCSRGG